MSTSVDHPFPPDINVNATFSKSTNRDGDIPSVSEICRRWRIFIHLFNDKTITILLVIFCSPVGRDPTLTDFSFRFVDFDRDWRCWCWRPMLLACREVSAGWVLTDALERPPLMRIPMWCNGWYKDVPIECGGKNSRIQSTRSQPEIQKLNSMISSLQEM